MSQIEVFDFAMDMEKDGETFYRECAARTSDSGIADILRRLADAEVRHYQILNQMKEANTAPLPEGGVDAGIKNVFARMLERGERFGGESSELDLYRKAFDIEMKSRDFYVEKAEELESPAAKELFLRIADEEKLHMDYIESIVEFVSRAEPGHWLEDAEWYHHDAY